MLDCFPERMRLWIRAWKKGPSHEEDTRVGVHRWCDHQRTWGGISTANISQFRSQSRLRPAASGVWLWAAPSRLRLWAASSQLRSRLWPARSVLSQLRGWGTRVLPARPIPNHQRMPARLDCAGWPLQALSGLLANLPSVLNSTRYVVLRTADHDAVLADHPNHHMNAIDPPAIAAARRI